MATINIKPYTDSPTFAFTGTWGAYANNAAWSSNSMNLTSTIGDKATITWSGRCLLLFMGMESGGADFTIKTDGVTRSVKVCTCEQTGGVTNTVACKVPVYIERGLTDTSHTTEIQSVTTGSNTKLYIDAAIIITGSVTSPANNYIYDALGDSWSVGTGATQASQGYTYHIARRLKSLLKHDIAFNLHGVGGTGLTALSGTLALTGIEQIIAANADAPKYMSFQYGVNDLRTGAQLSSPGFYADNLRTALMLIEDIFDVSNMIVSVATPGYITKPFRYKKSAYSNDMSDASGYGIAVEMSRIVISEFSWARKADVYSFMNNRDELLYPNAAPDNGLHPNNAGHKVNAEAHLFAMLS